MAERRAEQEKGVLALRDATKLSRERYDSGLANYLEILIADQQLFQLELELARTRGDEMRALSQLYRALGGGWRAEEAARPEDYPLRRDALDALVPCEGREAHP